MNIREQIRNLTRRIKRRLRRRKKWSRRFWIRKRRVQELRADLENARAALRAARQRQRNLREGTTPRELTPEQRREYLDATAEEREAIESEIDRIADTVDRVIIRRNEARKIRNEERSRIDRLKRRRKRIRRERSNWMSDDFHVREFDCRDGTDVPRAAYDGLRHLCRNYLQVVRDRHGPVRSTSGFRTRTYNARIGGASNSQHIYDAHPDGVAVDFVCDGATPSLVASILDSLGIDGLGRYRNFTHGDNRKRDGWAPARWSG